MVKSARITRDFSRRAKACSIGLLVATSLVASGGMAAPASALTSSEESAADELSGALAPTPTISSIALVGDVLAVSGAEAQNFTPAADTVSYQWMRDGSVIPDAVEPTYTVTYEDLSTALSLQVTGYREGYAPTSGTSQPTAPVQRGELAGEVPQILGVASFGQTLTVNAGTWTDGTELTFQWYADQIPIWDATSSSYALRMEDIGRQISVTVTGSRPGYSPTSRSSVPVVVGLAKLQSSAPSIVGMQTVGAKLKAEPGLWTAGTTFKYQWNRNGSAIPAATQATYVLQAADAGKRISVSITGQRNGFEDLSEVSENTGTVAKATLSSATPKVSGKVKVGSTLKVTRGTWTSGTAFSYQWYRNGSAISGAKSSSYKLKSADVGRHIKVKVTGTKAGYNSASKTSSTQTNWTLSTSTPKITGTAKYGAKLRASTGKWTSGTKFKYQWLQNGRPITKATSSSYKLKPSDVSKRISVKVTGSKTGFNSASKTSSATSKIAKATLRSKTPQIVGKMAAGSKVRVQPGSWTAGTKFTYQWYRNGKAISGAKSSTYTLRAADAEKNVSVRVTGSKTGYKSTGQTSPPRYVTITLGQKNAVATAKSYLKYSAFSRTGLIGQLEFEGYSTTEATFAVDYISPNWNKQAAEVARSYMRYGSFSRQGLIDQLLFEGFTRSQALYGVRAVGY
ncbi:Ltp family lipoprotein [Leucobacter sp. NPDC077196]|uniref:Ltp family lipoprotein n=1 Tax=Leucobacter sp. NPDC077196 TaxID=3154959 RepID=UPI00343C0873